MIPPTSSNVNLCPQKNRLRYRQGTGLFAIGVEKIDKGAAKGYDHGSHQTP